VLAKPGAVTLAGVLTGEELTVLQTQWGEAR